METYRSAWTDFLGQPITQRWVDVGGVATRVLETGEAGAPVLILLHGVGGHAEAYTRNLGAHAPHFHTYAIDMLAHGFTGGPVQPTYEIDDYVEHLRAFMDAIGAKTACISGESLGGWVAMAFALKYPERLDKLVLNTAGGFTAIPEVMARLKTITQAAVRNPSWDTVRARLEFLMADPKSVTDDLIATRLAIYAQPHFIEAMDRILCLQEMDIRRRNMITIEQLGQIKTSTFVIWTTHDPTAPASVGEEIASHIPGAGFVVMQDCGHWPQFEDAETFNRLHLNFLLGR
jgi:2-hydroxy-6-oxonona-2,4-dienedioate hydrolase